MILTRPHECYRYFCKLCAAHVSKDHTCCWSPPDDSKRKKCLERQQKFNVSAETKTKVETIILQLVFFDFETVVLEDGIDVHKLGVEQWPNLVVYNRFCHQCINDSSCSRCGIREGFFRYMENDNMWSLTGRFLDWVLNDSVNDNALFIAHNGSRFDLHFLVRCLVLRGIFPSLILNGSQIVRLEITPLRGQKINRVVFKDSYLLVPLPLSALPGAFGVPELSKGEFPYLFNHPVNYGKVLPTLPDRKYFCVDRKKAAALKKFEIWYEERFNQPFNFDEELLEYCKLDVKILTECIKRYMVLATETSGWNPIVHCHTFASYSLFQVNCLNLVKILTIFPKFSKFVNLYD